MSFVTGVPRKRRLTAAGSGARAEGMTAENPFFPRGRTFVREGSALKWGRAVGIALEWILLGPSVSNAHPLADWQQETPLPTIEDLTAITFANGQYVGVGTGGTLIRSNDGIHWVTQSTGVSDPLLAIAQGGDRWVIAGSSFLLTSSNAVDWHMSFVSPTRDSDQYYGFHGVTYGNGVFVAIGGGCVTKHCQSSIVYSHDGENWSAVTNIA